MTNIILSKIIFFKYKTTTVKTFVLYANNKWNKYSYLYFILKLEFYFDMPIFI